MSQNMTLSMTPYTQAGNFVCSQYDVGRECQITLQDENGSYTIPTGATVTIQATKPSGFGFSVECTWSGSTVTFATTETMTSEFGRFPAELRITQGDTILGTTNFYFKVERSPHPEGTVDGDSETAQALTLRVDALETEVSNLKSDIGDLSELETEDKSSLVDAINEARGSGGDGLTADIKTALLQIAQKVAYIDDDGQDYYDALEDALYPPAELVSISAVYTQSGTVYDTYDLDDLRDDLVVTATYSDSTTATVTTYTLSGTLTEGTSTITVAYGGFTTTFNVTVTHSTIPSGYTQYDYIMLNGVHSGNGYGIPTDIAMSSDYTLDTSILPTVSDSIARCLFGTRGASNAKQFAIFVTGGNGKMGYWYGGTDTSNIQYPFVLNQINTIKVKPVGTSEDYPQNAVINVNGTDYNTNATTTGTTWRQGFGIFQYVNSSDTLTGDIMYNSKLGEIIIKDSLGNVVHDLKPVNNGTYNGVYDLIAEEFYYNATYANDYVCGNWE